MSQNRKIAFNAHSNGASVASAHALKRCLLSSSDAKPEISIIVSIDDPALLQCAIEACNHARSFTCTICLENICANNPAALAERSALSESVAIIDQRASQTMSLCDKTGKPMPCIVLTEAQCGLAYTEGSCLVFMPIAQISADAVELAIHVARSAHINALATRSAQDAAEDKLQKLKRCYKNFSDDVASLIQEITDILPTSVSLGAWQLESTLMRPCQPTLENVQLEPSDTQIDLLNARIKKLTERCQRQQSFITDKQFKRVDFGAMLERQNHRFEEACAKRGQTLVIFTPPEPLCIACCPVHLENLMQSLIAIILERTPPERRIEVLLWRSLDDARITIVTTATTRRRFAETGDPVVTAQSPVREANYADAVFFAVIAELEVLGATITMPDGGYSKIVIALPFID